MSGKTSSLWARFQDESKPVRCLCVLLFYGAVVLIGMIALRLVQYWGRV